MYATFLRYEGFEVGVAENGAAALAVAQAYQPNVIVLDLTMPRMDGFEVARRLRLDQRTPPSRSSR
jgi:CheY-like chemotaxis protein